MDNRRFTALMLTMIFMYLWISVIAPALFPGWFPKPIPQQQAGVQVDELEDELVAGGDNGDADIGDAVDPPQDADAPDNHPRELVVLGSDDPSSNYYMQVVATTEGASLRTAEFNDPNLVTLDRQSPLSMIQPILSPQGDREYRTLTLAIPAIDSQLEDHDTNLSSIDWQIAAKDDSSVTFQFEYGGFVVKKTFTLQPGDPEKREDESQGYFVDVELSIENSSGVPQEIEYTWQGPVGVPLENVPNARTLQEVKVGALENHSNRDSITLVSRNADVVVDQVEAARAENDPNEIDTWRDPLVFVGVDVQYFAALMVADEDVLEDVNGDGIPDPTWQFARPRLLVENSDRPMASEISVLVRSRQSHWGRMAKTSRILMLFNSSSARNERTCSISSMQDRSLPMVGSLQSAE